MNSVSCKVIGVRIGEFLIALTRLDRRFAAAVQAIGYLNFARGFLEIARELGWKRSAESLQHAIDFAFQPTAALLEKEFVGEPEKIPPKIQ